MLLVRRREGQSILIGHNIEIHISDIGASKVTIGVVAPKEVSVTRTEVLMTREQNIAAAGAHSTELLARLAGALRK